jgi:hypothetical protein
MGIVKESESPMSSAKSFCASDYVDEVEEEKKISHSDKVSTSAKEVF